ANSGKKKDAWQLCLSHTQITHIGGTADPAPSTPQRTSEARPRSGRGVGSAHKSGGRHGFLLLRSKQLLHLSLTKGHIIDPELIQRTVKRARPVFRPVVGEAGLCLELISPEHHPVDMV